MGAKVEIFNEYFKELVESIQYCYLDIANECLSKKLISRATQRKILSGSKEDPSTTLVNAISACMVHQRDCFHKFLNILKGQLIFDELVERMEASLKEAINRKVMAECTDKPSINNKGNFKPFNLLAGDPVCTKTSPPRAKVGVMLVRQTVIKGYLPQMKTIIQGFIAPVARSSLTKQLISKETYQKVVNGNPSNKKQRTSFLLTSVCNSIRADHKKFDVFLEILENHRSCKDLVRKIKQDIERTTKDGKVSAIKQSQKSDSTERPPITLYTGLYQRRTTQQPAAELDGPIDVESGGDSDSKMVFGSGKTSTTKVFTPQVNPQKESEYFLRMDRKQDEARMQELSSQKLASMKENQQKQLTFSQEIIRLEGEMSEKDREIMSLKETRDNLQLAIDQIKTKVSFSEKGKHDSTALREKITELESKITEVLREKEELQCKLDNLNQEINSLQTSLRETQVTLKQTLSSLEDTQVRFSAATNQFCDATKLLQRQVSASTCNWSRSVVVVVVVVIIVIVVMCLYFYNNIGTCSNIGTCNKN